MNKEYLGLDHLELRAREHVRRKYNEDVEVLEIKPVDSATVLVEVEDQSGNTFRVYLSRTGDDIRDTKVLEKLRMDAYEIVARTLKMYWNDYLLAVSLVPIVPIRYDYPENVSYSEFARSEDVVVCIALTLAPSALSSDNVYKFVKRLNKEIPKFILNIYKDTEKLPLIEISSAVPLQKNEIALEGRV